MSPDVDLTVPLPGSRPLRERLLALDSRLFGFAAARNWPAGRPVLPRLSRAADHGVLWFATAAAMAASRTPRARRAAVRGVASLALASVTINTLGKRSVRRPRPALDPVPAVRQLKRQPITTSFPSGHAASAAAFAVRGLVPTRAQLGPPARPRAEVPTLPDGEGLVLVANTAAGSTERVRALRGLLPAAAIVECEPEEVAAQLEQAAARARVLGVCGGDGTVNSAAEVALRHGLPLAVLPGGTLNHFAYDLGVEGARDLAGALTRGEAVRVDVGRFDAGGRRGVFLNTLSLGVYPELVRVREQWSPRIGGWPAGVLAAARVLNADRHPLRAEAGGRPHPLWLLFAGNGIYHRMGLAPGRRTDLADGLLDVRVVHGGRRPALRLLAAAVAGPITRSPVHAAVRVPALRLGGVAPGTLLAYDGEVAEVSGRVTVDKLPQGLTVYRPAPAA
ncbi:phosphoesterase [Streptomyces sp. XM83C]|uniref:bifunctional phosphatase PAP2/diacylglycerol kinase family protein n=1 Tax=Streptomyces sp. XM83C TaxID=2929781 RepID=UPI001FF82DD0|nr:diacylglycerol kinase family protein [Streptomyces sp. XM83C]MCK1819008.1 phosphoesterase [Streptomyces sp. XM83C]